MGIDNTQVDMLGYRISAAGLGGDVATGSRFVESGRGAYVACINPHSVVVAGTDAQFKDALVNADLLIPDGAGILLAAKALNCDIRERVAGYEFFEALSAYLSSHGGARYFFLGSSEEVLGLITGRLHREFPGITVCGTCSPPFKESFSAADNAAIIDAVNAAAPDVLWVGMTAPKQEKWIYQNRDSLDVPFIGAIGAVFDFYAGTKSRSSRFWRDLGLEWLPRFLKEPRRLWERNLKSTPLFLWWVARAKVRKALAASSGRHTIT